MPWAPKKPNFHLPGLPGLIPIDNARPSTSSGNASTAPSLSGNVGLNSDEQAEMMRTQINLNTKVMEEIGILRRERAELMKKIEQDQKEKEILKMKVSQMNEQMLRFKKKASEHQANDENVDPNKGDDSATN